MKVAPARPKFGRPTQNMCCFPDLKNVLTLVYLGYFDYLGMKAPGLTLVFDFRKS